MILGDQSKLSLDPEAASYNPVEPMLRVIPEVTDVSETARRGPVSLRRALLRVDSCALISQLAELDLARAVLEDQLGRAAR